MRVRGNFIDVDSELELLVGSYGNCAHCGFQPLRVVAGKPKCLLFLVPEA